MGFLPIHAKLESAPPRHSFCAHKRGGLREREREREEIREEKRENREREREREMERERAN
jgi:hypothetical protein